MYICWNSMKQLLIFIFISSSCCAQTESNSLSAHFGYSMSNLLWTDGTKLKSTFNAGIEVRHQIKQSLFHLQSGIRWNEYGFRDQVTEYIWYTENVTINEIDYKSTSFYLTVPLITTYKFKKHIPGLTFSAGPQLSFYMFNKSRLNDDITFSVSNSKPLLNLGFYFATGYEHNINDNWIIGGEAYSNINLPMGSFFGDYGNYNFGVAITGRYILGKKD